MAPIIPPEKGDIHTPFDPRQPSTVPWYQRHAVYIAAAVIGVLVIGAFIKGVIAP